MMLGLPCSTSSRPLRRFAARARQNYGTCLLLTIFAFSTLAIALPVWAAQPTSKVERGSRLPSEWGATPVLIRHA